MRRPTKPGLLGQFALVSVIPMILLGLVLSQYLGNQIQKRTLAEAKRAGVLIARVGFQPQLSPIDLQQGLTQSQAEALDNALRSKGVADGVARVKVWNRAARIVYSNDRGLIGRRFLLFNSLRKALGGEISSEVSRLRRADNASERRYGRLLEVYVPIVFTPGAAPAGAVDVYLPYEPIANAIDHDTRTMYLLLLAGLGLLYGTLFRIVAGASKRLRRQAAALRQQAAENEHQALHDPLTGLPNRTLFADRIRQATLAARRKDLEVAVLLMDLDRFKEINDTLGHHCGDLLLKELGERIERSLRASDTVARLGGDEFGILLPDLHDRHAIDEVVGRFRGAIEEPFTLQGLPLAVEASIGVAVFPEHGEDVDTLLQKADVAMYVAKEANCAYQVYEAANDDYNPARLTLVGELRRAIDERELVVYYQPKANLRNGEVTSVEALIRWQHPTRGLIPPDEFIPLAQHTGLIGPLTNYVLREAMRQCRVWQQQGLQLSIAVNLAMRNILDQNFPAEVAELLESCQVDPSMLELEITESTIMADPFRAMAVLKELSEMGMRLAIDDFGTGYSSLAYLKRLPVNEVKIDKSFVLNMTKDKSDAAIVQSTIDLARNLGLEVVAEGVESEEIWKNLINLGCHSAQGFYLSRPLSATALSRWVKGPHAREVAERMTPHGAVPAGGANGLSAAGLVTARPESA
jgi:diguanylate cyclase (GGDEF)-like protein